MRNIHDFSQHYQNKKLEISGYVTKNVWTFFAIREVANISQSFFPATFGRREKRKILKNALHF